jgi:hypothetical protein
MRSTTRQGGDDAWCPANPAVKLKRPLAMVRLRQQFFCAGGDAAVRYGIGFDRIVKHLWNARRHQRRLSLRSIDNMHDLIHAIACIDDMDRAWADLAEQYEPALVRACRSQMGDIEALLQVRRLLAGLRERSCSGSGHDPSLRWYTGSNTLRSWLGQRLLAGLSRRLRGRGRLDPGLLMTRARPGQLLEMKSSVAGFESGGPAVATVLPALRLSRPHDECG